MFSARWAIAFVSSLDLRSIGTPPASPCSLFHTAYLYASVIRGFTHAVIEVNPRHVAYYGRALGFVPIGPKRMNTRVNAPAVLLYAPFAAIAKGLALYAGKEVGTPGAGGSLFTYGFPPQEEIGVLKRLRELVAVG